MNRKHDSGGAAGQGMLKVSRLPVTASNRGRSILPLPEEVVAQIKSSTAIVSLTGVVLELLKNSLDAKATRIEATVDFSRGGCLVEDNGLGIAPSEFREDGGLGKLYCTSKYHSEDAYLGRHGTFIASLTAVSLLTIVSRHHEHRSHNLITFHHSKAIERQLPASPQHEIHEKHGCRVTVRNLFGNLPVRVKQRAVLAEQKAEHDRTWSILKREITGLFLSWQDQASLKVRDGDGKPLLCLSNTAHTMNNTETRPPKLNHLLSILTQADYILSDEWPSWVPVSASTSAISIKGAISLNPAPSRRAQFISLGNRPLSVESGHNELYDEVNRKFSLSSFGVVEDDADCDENEKTRRQGDKRFKTDGYTNRQLKVRKGVDRYPMFHLRISLKSGRSGPRLEQPVLEDEANMQAVVEVVGAMITQWLSVHYFRPRKPRIRRNPPSTASTSTEEIFAEDTISQSCSGTFTSSSVKPTELKSLKRKKVQSADQTSERVQSRAFAEWSRIKSSKADFFDTSGTNWKRQNEKSVNSPCIDLEQPPLPTAHSCSPTSPAIFDMTPVLPGALNLKPDLAPQCTAEKQAHRNQDKYDETMIWTDPSSKQTFILNARTGCVLPHQPTRSSNSTSMRAHETTLSEFNRALRLPRRPAASRDEPTPWLDGVLKAWDNPVFKPAEAGIQQTYLIGDGFECHDHKREGRSQHSRDHTGDAFSGPSTSSISRISRDALRSIQVLAQVDKKFILAKTQNSGDSTSNLKAGNGVLLLIDQHAADERIRVEALFIELCRMPPEASTSSGYKSKLGHTSRVAFTTLEKPIQFAVSSHEQAQFSAYAAKFAAWGILFDILDPTITSVKRQSVLSVTTLPPVVSERCKSDPQVLITFLRSAVWKYADAPTVGPNLNKASSSNDAASWVRQLASCPEGLIDLINSRACRSAIMFNDELSLEQCKELVQNLADCVFPFMCAHGRPSMVPLVDLDFAGGELTRGFGFEKSAGLMNSEKGFIQAWKECKK